MRSYRGSRACQESGFTLIEVMIAAILLSIGLVVLAYGYGQGLEVVLNAKEDTIARQKARETIESVSTALNTTNLDFANICNLSLGSACIYVDGFTDLCNAGNDGIFGTADDCTSPPPNGGIQTIIDPGPDGLLGTSDDIVVPLTGFQRQVQVTILSPILRQITVTIKYKPARGMVRSVVLTTYVSPYT